MTVYGYARVSTTRQADQGESLEVQKRKIQGYADMEGLTVAKVFIERGVSAARGLAERPEGRALLDRLEPGDAVICSKLDRMFRSAADALQTCETFSERQIDLHLLDLGHGSVTGENGNGISHLVFTILSAVAEFERGRIAERISETKAKLREEGRYQGGVVPFGYRLTKDNMLEPVAAEQRAVKRIVKLRADGKSLRATAADMAKRGFKLSHQRVSDILDRQED